MWGLTKMPHRGNGENVDAQLRVLVKRILRKYGYPPDKQEKATQTVLEQAEALSEEWAEA
jgi:type I restriction enzyme R subunit